MNHPYQRASLAAPQTDQAVALCLRGEIDFGNAEATSHALGRASADLPTHALVVLDLTGVTHLSVAGARALYRYAAGRAEHGARTHLVVEPRGVVARVAELSGLDRHVRVCTSLPAALDTRHTGALGTGVTGEIAPAAVVVPRPPRHG